MSTYGENTSASQPADPLHADLLQESDIEIAAITHRGLVRKGNEDHYAVIRRVRTTEVMSTSIPDSSDVDLDERAWLLIVADGLGGEVAGEEASEAAIRSVMYFANELSSWVMRPTGRPRDDIAERAQLYAEAIQKELQLQSAFAPELTGMGTTLTGAYVMGDEAVIVNVGDSRTYLLRDAELKLITRDHTVAQEMQDRGSSEEDIQEFRHLLTRSFTTTGEPVTVDISHIDLTSGDQLLLCSDGLSDLVTDDRIRSVISNSNSTKAGSEALVKEALDAGGTDNVTVVLARIA